MTSNDELERQRFEAAIREKFGDLVDLRICANGDGEYLAWDAQVAYHAWQAAIASRQEQSDGETDISHQR